MTELINRLNIKYKPWKISGVKDGNKKVWAETSETASDERVESLEKDGWTDVSVIAGKEIEQEAA